jgi:L-Lysine epsilon oxidase N-terminal
MATIYKIHPAIGTARIGNSAEYYPAPDAPGALPLDPNSGKPIYAGPGVPAQNIFHDASGALRWVPRAQGGATRHRNLQWNALRWL